MNLARFCRAVDVSRSAMSAVSDPIAHVKALAADAMKAFDASSTRRIGALTAAKWLAGAMLAAALIMSASLFLN